MNKIKKDLFKLLKEVELEYLVNREDDGWNADK
jgi:hypothetical protein